MTWRKPFRPFRDMIHLGVPTLTGNDDFTDLAGLIPGRGAGRLLLGKYGEEQIREAVTRFGIWDRVKGLGFVDFSVAIDASDPDHQRVQFHAIRSAVAVGEEDMPDSSVEALSTSEPVAEIILREALLKPTPELMACQRALQMLVIQWICLQNPLATVDRRTLLPGQKYAGLGAGSQIMEMLIGLARQKKLDGIVNRPEFIHNAILYSRFFKYLNPDPEGRLRGLVQQLAHLSMRQIAWAVDRGWVLEDDSKAWFRWYQSEQVWPNCAELHRHFDQSDYRRKVEETMNRVRFTLVPDAMEKLREVCI